MPALALLLVMVMVACATCAILGIVRHLRKPAELRGDWWSEFEREFRAYAKTSANRNRERRRHRGERA